MKVLHVVGARPNFMKIAPIMQEMALHPDQFKQMLIHTGQHYDKSMSQVFFDELELPLPDINLEVGSGSHAQQTALIMQKFEPVILAHQPDWVVVPGDVNSSLACALVACKLGIKVAHVEAGLRSYDRSMPEEINRILTDQLSDLLLTPSVDANQNLLKEGIAEEKIRFVGNVMIDTVAKLLPKAKRRFIELVGQYPILNDSFVLVTLHRPSNVDDGATLQEILSALQKISQDFIVVFPVHPRTRKRIVELNLVIKSPNLYLLDPLSYLEFLGLQEQAQFVITDSGGVQEETSYLGTPCITVRPNTERPITISEGTNRLVESKAEAICAAAYGAVAFKRSQGASNIQRRPQLWDGKSAARIVAALLQ